MIRSILMIMFFTFLISLLVISGNSISRVQGTVPSGSPIHAPYIITAYYHDTAYYVFFHKQHTGVDMVPKGDKKGDKVILYATMDGTAYRYSEQCAGNAVLIINKEYMTYYGHIASFLIGNTVRVKTNTPIAIMGDSGKKGICITGPHVHYGIYKYDSGKYIVTDPLPYL